MKHIVTTIAIFTVIIPLSVCQAQTSFSGHNTFVIVLDVQADYTEDLDPETRRQAIESINRVINNTKPENVNYVVSLHKALNISFKGIYIDTIVATDLDSNIIVVNDRCYSKEEGNGFSVADLHDYLIEKNAQEIIVTGLLAEKCVSSTLIGGLELGYNMIVIPEAIIGKSEKRKKKAIKKLQEKGVSILSIDEYCNK